MEVPFDASSLDGQQVTLTYAPSLKVKAGEKVACEPAYFGVYRRGPGEMEKKGMPFRQPRHAWAAGQVEEVEELPLRCESDAMVAMTSAILGPFRFGLVPMACGWHSEMEHGTYTDQSVAGDMKSLDFLAECGIDWVSDSHPWGGETEKMNALGENDKYEPGPLVRKFLDHARKVGVKVVMWSSMNNTHAWGGQGRPFRSDKPEWRMSGQSAEHAQTAWAMRTAVPPLADADQPGGHGRRLLQVVGHGRRLLRRRRLVHDVVPVDCQSDQHDHLPGDSNYACQRALVN